MKRIQRKLVLLFLFGLLPLLSRAYPKDSLLIALKSHPHRDSVRVNILIELCRQYRNENPDSASGFGRQALDLSRAIKFFKGEAVALNYLGIVYFYEGNYVKADTLQGASIQVCLKNKLLKALTNAYNSAGLSKQYQNDYVTAIGFYLKALEIEELHNNTAGRVKVMSNLGSAYRNLGDREICINYYLQADKLNKTLPASQQMHGIATNIGNYYAYSFKYDDALRFYLQALEENKLHGPPYSVALSYNNAGFCYLQMKKPTDAGPYIEEAFRMLDKQNVGNIKSLILLNMGSLRLMQGKIDESLNYSKSALTIAIQNREKERESMGYRNLAEAFQFSGEYKKADQYWEKAYLLNDSLHNNEITRTIGNIQKGYELAKKQTEIDLLSQETRIKSLSLDQEKGLRYFLSFSILVLLVVSGLIGYNIRNKNKLNRRLQNQNEAIDRQKKVIEAINQTLEEKAARAQMNPHFIFNALNSIQHLIVNKNNGEAFAYLVSFSSLLRGLLEFSDRQTVTLREEIEMLRLYLQLESLRFDNGFTYTIKDENVNTDAFVIPPLLLQPFAENAIIHGLINKGEDKKLIISFLMEGEDLICKIEDNGVGRLQASKNKEQKDLHVSRSMEITRDRLIVFNHTTRESIIIDDLYDHDGLPKGTLVTLRFINVA